MTVVPSAGTITKSPTSITCHRSKSVPRMKHSNLIFQYW
ncbi:hypothetical protein Taro_038343 [Colocasia esculenta]|uniref:Uncharacterized protein n=1 Tax=Colocasia esculenta TaxID=4460 RepID=A0A843W377_COLES|nr:hypothetical protein [Colocasia esculenta]